MYRLAYIENILQQRHSTDDDVGKLKQHIFELETSNAALQSRLETVSKNDNVIENTAELEAKFLAQDLEIRTLKQQKMTLAGYYKKVVDERDVLARLQGNAVPNWMSTNTYNQVIQYVQELQKLAKFKTLSSTEAEVRTRDPLIFEIAGIGHLEL